MILGFAVGPPERFDRFCQRLEFEGFGNEWSSPVCWREQMFGTRNDDEGYPLCLQSRRDRLGVGAEQVDIEDRGIAFDVSYQFGTVIDGAGVPDDAVSGVPHGLDDDCGDGSIVLDHDNAHLGGQ